MRFELPPDLPPEEVRAVLRALEQYFGTDTVRPEPWALAGRADGLELGALQIRHQALVPWQEVRVRPHTRRGTGTLWGRADAK